MGLDLSTTQSTTDLEGKGRTITLLRGGRPWMDGDKPVTARIVGSYSKRMQDAFRERDEAVSRNPAMTDDERTALTRVTWGKAVLEWGLDLNGKMADPAFVFEHWPETYDQIVRESANHAGFFVAASAG